MASERELNILIKARDMASSVLEKHEKNFERVGKSMVAVGTLGVTGLGAAVKVAMDFEQQMDRVSAIAQATESEMAALNKTALELGANTSKSASEVAIGMEDLAAMGFSVNEIIGAMPGVISAAEASGADMAQTANVMAAAINIFGLEATEATRVADILAQTANVSAADITDMQYALKYAGPPAAALGVSLEELSASIGIMTDSGMEGSQAGTSLRQVMLALLDPSKENIKLMDQLGIAMTDNEGAFVGISGLIGQLETATNGMTDAQKAATLSQLVGKEAVSGLLSLVAAGPAEIDEFTASLMASEGASAAAAAIMKDNLAGAMEELGGTIETIAITVGTILTPMLQGFADGLSNLLGWFNTLDPSMQEMITKGIAIGSVFMLIMGGILLVIPMLPALASALGSLFGPVGLVIAGVTALAAAISTNFMGSRDIIMDFVAKCIEWFNKLKETVWPIIQTLFDTIKNFLAEHGESIKTMLFTAWNAISTAIEFAIDLIVFLIEWAWPYIQQIIEYTLDYIVPFIVKMFTKVSSFINEILPPLLALFKFIWTNGIETIVQGVMMNLWSIIKFIWPIISNIIEGALDVIMGLVRFFVALFTGDWQGVWDATKQILEGAWRILLAFLGESFDKILEFAKNMIDDVITFFTNFKGDALELGKNMIMGLVDGVKAAASQLVDSVVNAVKGAWEAAKSFLGINSPSRLFMELGVFTGQGFGVGIDDAADYVAAAASNMGALAWDNAQQPLDGGAFYPQGGGSGGHSTTVVLQFGEGAIVLDHVTDAKKFVDELEEMGLNEAFKNE